MHGAVYGEHGRLKAPSNLTVASRASPILYQDDGHQTFLALLRKTCVCPSTSESSGSSRGFGSFSGSLALSRTC